MFSSIVDKNKRARINLHGKPLCKYIQFQFYFNEISGNPAQIARVNHAGNHAGVTRGMRTRVSGERAKIFSQNGENFT
jgi:hypothetical protein